MATVPRKFSSVLREYINLPRPPLLLFFFSSSSHFRAQPPSILTLSISCKHIKNCIRQAINHISSINQQSINHLLKQSTINHQPSQTTDIQSSTSPQTTNNQSTTSLPTTDKHPSTSPPKTNKQSSNNHHEGHHQMPLNLRLHDCAKRSKVMRRTNTTKQADQRSPLRVTLCDPSLQNQPKGKVQKVRSKVHGGVQMYEMRKVRVLAEKLQTVKANKVEEK